MQTYQQDRVRIARMVLPDIDHWTERHLKQGWRIVSPTGCPIEDTEEVNLPDYFTDANAALTICEFMRKEGYSADIQWYAHHSWRTQFYHPEKYYPDSYVDGTGDTLAQSICTAFIAFLDARKEGL